MCAHLCLLLPKSPCQGTSKFGFLDPQVVALSLGCLPLQAPRKGVNCGNLSTPSRCAKCIDDLRSTVVVSSRWGLPSDPLTVSGVIEHPMWNPQQYERF